MKQAHERRQELLSTTLAVVYDGGSRIKQVAQLTKTLNISYTVEVMSFNQPGGQTARTIRNSDNAPAPR